MQAEELWAEFCQKKNIDINTPYEAWAFCGGGKEGDELADLVLEGKKFGTASAYDEYVLEDALEEVPKVGEYSVILRDNEEAMQRTIWYSFIKWKCFSTALPQTLQCGMPSFESIYIFLFLSISIILSINFPVNAEKLFYLFCYCYLIYSY